MKMKRMLLVFGLMMLAAHCAAGQLLVDSLSTNPSYIEAGDNVDVYVKFHEDPSTWKLTSVKSSSGERIPVGKDKDVYYVSRISAADDISRQYLILKIGERDVGHLYYGESWTTPFEIKVKDTAPEGIYGLEFQIVETNIAKTAPYEVVMTKRFNLTVEGNPKLAITSDSELTAGETEKFKVSVSNVGGGIAKHVTVELNATDPLTVLKSSSTYVGDMSGRTFKDLSYELHVDSAATPKAYTIPVDIRYTDRNGVDQTVKKNLGVKVAGMPMVTASLEEFEDFKAGTTGKVTVSVINKGFIDAKFLSVQMLDTDDYTVTSNSDIYIGNLASDDFETEDFTVKVAEGVSGKMPLKVKVSYTEENNNQMHVEERKLEMNVMSDDEYYKQHPKTNGTQQLVSAVMLLPAIVVAYIVLWLLFKIVGAITGFIDRKIFRRT
ncbi:MAG: hypothetical protein ABIH11_08160 [Candidatus Altiarchaeota archaeon]